MDVKEVRQIISALDAESYHSAAMQKTVTDEVWPVEIEDAFIAAVRLFASVGQRKYHLEEKKHKGSCSELVGRNDIISRYIFMKTSQYRARKQVSSHIQVWVHCKKPPSNHSMNMETFLDIQTVFRLHYSRPNTGHGNIKKTRRIVSAGTARTSMDKEIASCNSLGLYQTTSTPSEIKDSSTARKHSMPGLLISPAKRCRRVVSELPPSSLGLMLTPSAMASPMPQGEDNGMYGSGISSYDVNRDGYAHVPLFGNSDEEHALASFQSSFGDVLMPQSAGFAPQESVTPQVSKMVQQDKLPFTQLSSGMCDITHGSKNDANSTAAAFMMATIAAMEGYETLASGGMTHNAEHALCANEVPGNGLDIAAQSSEPLLSSEQATSSFIDLGPTFTAGTSTPYLPDELVCNLTGPYISATDSVSATMFTKQINTPDVSSASCSTDALAEAFSWYCLENGLGGIMPMQAPEYVREGAQAADMARCWYQSSPSFKGISTDMACLDLTKIHPFVQDLNTSSMQSQCLVPENCATTPIVTTGLRTLQANIALKAEEPNTDTRIGSNAKDKIHSQKAGRKLDQDTYALCKTKQRAQRSDLSVPLEQVGNGAACTPGKRSSSKESDITVVARASSISLNENSSPILAAREHIPSRLFDDKSATLGEILGRVNGAEDESVVDWISKLVGHSHAYSADQGGHGEQGHMDVCPLTHKSGRRDLYSILEDYFQRAD
ncbi:hypothetical protein H4217_008197 [Coemansia sp. RSA 1939]|nr:hypothetical protein H4217_008197 [Coemansia sp. RSA 1939]